MPFIHYRKGRPVPIEGPTRDIVEIHPIVIQRVIPSVRWELSNGGTTRRAPILPNLAQVFRTKDRGPTREHNVEEYFALACNSEGLSIPEVGLWLDTYLEKGFIDERSTQMLEGDKISILRLDLRKQIYFWEGNAHYLIGIGSK